jgi:hypothetical protein
VEAVIAVPDLTWAKITKLDGGRPVLAGL